MELVYSWEVFFFFQAEDGIRDLTVTGVQTCALPILGNCRCRWRRQYHQALFYQPGQRSAFCLDFSRSAWRDGCLWFSRFILGAYVAEIGRASCRERV